MFKHKAHYIYIYKIQKWHTLLDTVKDRLTLQHKHISSHVWTI